MRMPILMLTLGSPVAGRPGFAIAGAGFVDFVALVCAGVGAAGAPVSSSLIDLPLAIELPLLP